MKKIGFVKSKKENEKRIAIVFEDINKIEYKNQLYFEEGYFENFGISDKEVIDLGCNVSTFDEVIKCDIICDPKIGDEEYLNNLDEQIIFGWVHATQNKNITDTIIDKKLTAFAWEKMFDNNIHTFYKNNQIAGQAAVLHAMLQYGDTFEDKKIAILGDGNVSKGAQGILDKLDLSYDVYNFLEEDKFKKQMYDYDVIINAILWDTTRNDHIIYKSDLSKMKKNSLIIDISCDRNGGIETSIPTTIDNPIYFVDGIMHYAVDHTPSLLYRESSKSISKEVVKYINMFLNDNLDNAIMNSLIIENGVIIDDEINKFQKRGQYEER